MILFRYNRLLLSHFNAVKPSRLVVRHATEVRSRRPVRSDSSTRPRKNTADPVAQIKKLGAKAGRRQPNGSRIGMPLLA